MSIVLANAVVATSRLERVSFFAVFAQSMSGAGGSFSICSSSCAVLGVGIRFSTSYHWQIRLEILSKLFANMILMRNCLFSYVGWMWKSVLQILNLSSDNGSVAGNIVCEV